MNNPAAPELADEGHDLLVGQNPDGGPRTARLRDAHGQTIATLTARDRWVIPTGGGFFFAPSVAFLQSLDWMSGPAVCRVRPPFRSAIDGSVPRIQIVANEAFASVYASTLRRQDTPPLSISDLADDSTGPRVPSARGGYET